MSGKVFKIILLFLPTGDENEGYHSLDRFVKEAAMDAMEALIVIASGKRLNQVKDLNKCIK